MRRICSLLVPLLAGLVAGCGSPAHEPKPVTVFPAIFTENVPARDGKHLATDVYLPTSFTVGVSRSFPVVLTRTPYGRKTMGNPVKWAAAKGIASVVQDTRGRFASEGTDAVFQDDGFGARQDGYDTVEWIAAQPWSNGKVCTWGPSALGITQILMAPANPPHLVCQLLIVAPANMYEHAAYQGGVMRKELTTKWLEFQEAESWFPFVESHAVYDSYWAAVNALSKIEDVHVPAMIIGGWYDIFSEGSLATFRNWQHYAGEGARGKAKLIMGPSDHIGTALLLHDLGRSIAANTPGIDGDAIGEQWLTNHLLGEQVEADEAPTVRYFVMDGEQYKGWWNEASDWPPPATTWTLVLNDGFRLGGPPGAPAEETFAHDPTDPVPTFGGRNLFNKSGAFDQITLSTRPRVDRLLFQSGVLAEGLTVAGEVKALLRGKLDGDDAHWSVQLLDITPGGKHLLVTEGSLRAQLNESLSKAVPVMAGIEVDYAISVLSTAWHFKAGHRIGVSVAGSDAPRLAIYPHERAHTILINGPSTVSLPVLVE